MKYRNKWGIIFKEDFLFDLADTRRSDGFAMTRKISSIKLEFTTFFRGVYIMYQINDL